MMLIRLLAITLIFVAALPAVGQDAPEQPRNVVFMIPDGFGPASLTMARLVLGERLAMDEVLTGSVGTAAIERHITDSATSATAYASGIQTRDRAIGVDSLGRPVGTILQGAQMRGMRTGIVTNTRLSHATPAAFAAHVESRDMEEEIARQMMARGIDLLFGGGTRYLLPEPSGSRTDGRDLITESGYAVVSSAAELEGAESLPLLGLFAGSHMGYEIDRHHTDEPSVAEMTRKALDLLADSPNGFFLMIEGGLIDFAGHRNDAASHLREVLAYDEAVAVALEFARADGRTLVVSAADHETGGLTIGRDGRYFFDPDVLLQTTASGDRMGAEARRRAGDGPMTVDLLAAILAESTPLTELDEYEREALTGALASTDYREPGRTMARLVGRRAGIGWTTTGHTAVDVPLHAFGPGSELLTGHLHNYEVGLIVAGLLGIDLDEVTEQVRSELGEAVIAE